MRTKSRSGGNNGGGWLGPFADLGGGGKTGDDESTIPGSVAPGKDPKQKKPKASGPAAASEIEPEGGGAKQGPLPDPKPPQPAVTPAVQQYRKFNYVKERSIEDRIAFMPCLIGAFEHASRGPSDCYLTTPISNFRLPEVRFSDSQWNRRTWRDTNRVHNALLKLKVDPYDVMYTLGEKGARSMGPLKDVLGEVSKIEALLVDSLEKNKANIASSASNARWLIAENIKSVITGMGTAASLKDVQHQVIDMIKSVFRYRYRHYEQLPFKNKSHHNNEIWNGIDYAPVFYGSLFLTTGDHAEAIKLKYVAEADAQEQLNIDIAITSIQRIGQLYDQLVAVLDKKDPQSNDFLTEVDNAFKEYNLQARGLSSIQGHDTLSSGSFLLELQKVTGTYLWELLLERFEILRSNVFSYFSIVMHDNDDPEGKQYSCDKRASGSTIRSAAEVTDLFMEKAIPSCLAHLFLKLCPVMDAGTMRIDQEKSKDNVEVKAYFEAMHNHWSSGCSGFIAGIQVPSFAEVSKSLSEDLDLKSSSYVKLTEHIALSVKDVNVLRTTLKKTPDVKSLATEHIQSIITDQYDEKLALMDVHKLGRNIISGTPHEHPLKHFANRARDLIYSTLKKRMDITNSATDFVYNAVCKIVYANYCSDGAFVALLSNYGSMDASKRIKFARRYYRAAHNPIAIEKSVGIDYTRLGKADMAQDAITKKAFDDWHTVFVAGADILAVIPQWVISPSTESKVVTVKVFANDAKYSSLFKLKPDFVLRLTSLSDKQRQQKPSTAPPKGNPSKSKPPPPPPPPKGTAKAAPPKKK